MVTVLVPFYHTSATSKIITVNGKTWGLYDEHHVTLMSEGPVISRVQSNPTVETKLLQAETNVGIYDDGPWLSRSFDIERLRDILRNGTLLQTYTSTNVGICKFRMLQRPREVQHSGLFKSDLEDLPEEYDEKAYMDTIKKYGTHYYNEAVLGGRVEIMNKINLKYASMVGPEHVLDQMRREFEFLKVLPTSRRNERAGSLDYNRNTELTIRIIGGRPGGYELDQYALWLQNIIEWTQIISYKVARISDTIPNQKKLFQATFESHES